MRPVLMILMILVFAADLVAFLQLRRRINSWGSRLEEPLSDQEQRYVQSRLKLVGVLSIVLTGLFLVNCVFYEILPLIFD